MGFGPQHEDVTVVNWFNPETEALETVTMKQANYASKGGYSFRKWYNCHICGLSYPEDEVVLDEGGAAFCYRFGHYEEIDKPTAGSFKFGSTSD